MIWNTGAVSFTREGIHSSLLALSLSLTCAVPAAAIEGDLVQSVEVIGEVEIGFTLDQFDRFGLDVAWLGDVDGDGFPEVAAGARGDDDLSGAGAVYIFSLDTDGTVLGGTAVKISETSDPNNTLALATNDQFGTGIAGLGDYDGDGNYEIAVGTLWGEEPGAPAASGRVWILDLDPVTFVPQSSFTIGSGTTNFTTLDADDNFGRGVASAGDWDGDGAPELLVGAHHDDDGATQNGAVYVLYLAPPAIPNDDATGIHGYTKISDTAGGFDGSFTNGAIFGTDVTGLADIDEDGQTDIAVGAPFQSAGGTVWVLFMDPGCAVGPGSCGVKSGSSGYSEIAEDLAGFDEGVTSGSLFGQGIDWIAGDNGENARLVVGADSADYGGTDRGAVFLLSLASDGSVSDTQRISSGFNSMPALGNSVRFGVAVTGGDLDDDSQPDLIVGSFAEAGNEGRVRSIRLNACSTLISNVTVYHSPDDNGVRFCPPPALDDPNPTLHLYVDSGDLATAIPANVCVEGAGEGDEICAVDVRLDLENYTAQSFAPSVSGATTNAAQFPTSSFRLVWIPTAATLGPIKLGDLAISEDSPGGSVKIAAGSAAIDAELLLEQVAPQPIALPEPGGAFGLAAGLTALLLLARRRAKSLRRALLGCVAVVLLLPGPSAEGAVSVKDFVQIDPNATASASGSGLAPVGDIDGDGVADLMTGSPGAHVCLSPVGEASIQFLDRDGSVLGDEGPSLADSGNDLGLGMASVGDLDGDGIQEVAVGVRTCVGSPTADLEGALFILSFDSNGNETARLRIGQGLGGFGGTLDVEDVFGRSVALLGDVDGDGNVEIAVGAVGDDDGASNAGAVWILSLNAPAGTVAWEQKISATEGGFVRTPDVGDNFGGQVAGIGDLDGNGVPDLAVSSPSRDHPTTSANDYGAVWILFLGSTGPGNVSVIGQQEISVFDGGFAGTPGYLEFFPGSTRRFGFGMAWQAIPGGGGRGILYAGTDQVAIRNNNNPLYVLYIDNDGTVITSYLIEETNGVGFDPVQPNAIDGLGYSIVPMGDLDGDEVSDIAIGAPESGGLSPGLVYLFFMRDTDHDGLDENLDNCPDVHNPLQEDADGDGVGDLCDNCVDLANTAQADFDTDGEGDLCEPVEIQLVTTGTPAAPSWDLKVQCGAFDVTQLNTAIVMPEGATGAKTLTLNGATIGAGSSTSGPGLVTPAGVRDDAIYFTALGNSGTGSNQLCSALDPPTQLGVLTTGAITAGPQLDSAALSAEGVGNPGFMQNLADDTAGAVPITEIRLVNGIPLPVLDLELGPAVATSGGTRWDVLLRNATDEFHRVAFGLIAPVGTTTGAMRWVGCDTTPVGNGERSCNGATGFGTTANAGASWTVGPQGSPPGTQVPDTLYVVLEGNRVSLSSLDTLNPDDGPATVVLGTVELDGSPDLEPALTTDGVNDIDDFYGAGTVTPFEEADFDTPAPDQVKLIGAFNPAADLDSDGWQDLGDNCPFEYNPSQTNRGSFLDATDESDVLGDACQCGESSDDGAVLDPDDFDDIRGYLAGNITGPAGDAIEARCSVAGTTECNIRDLIFLKQAIDAAALTVETRCDAALSPATGP